MASPQDVQAMQQQLQALQEQTAALTEGLRRASQAHEATQRRLSATETQLAATKAELEEKTSAKERSLIHPSNVPKPPIFTGKKEEWEKFKHVFVAWSSTVHGKYPELLEKYGSAKDPVDELGFTEEEDRLAKAMYTFLMQYCPEPTMNVVGQGLHDANGFEIWRRLVKLSEPAYRTKAWVWRKHLSNPNFPTDIAMWSSALHQWESELREYERTFKTPFSEDEKIAILAHVSPKELQQSIFMHSDALNTYDKMREYIEQYLVNKNVWKRPQGSQFGLTKVTNKNVDDPNGPMPMDIGAVAKGGKGNKGDKGKGKGGKGKDSYDQGNKAGTWKWYDSDKGTGKGGKPKGNPGKGKGGSSDKGKGGKGKGSQEKGTGKGGQVNNPDAGKQCHVCKKFGHLAANCWWKVGAVESSASNAKEQPSASTGGSGNVGAVLDFHPSPSSMIFTVGDSRVSAVGKTGNTRYLLVDSGACESVAKQGDFHGEIDSTKARPLFSVQGNPLQVHGKQYPEVQLGNLKGNIEMTVTDSAESLVSVHSLVAWGHEVHFTKDACYMVTNQGETIPLELHGKRWYLKVQHFADSAGQASRSSTGKHPGGHCRVAPVEAGRKIEEEREPDEWRREEKDGDKFLIRVHNTPRFQLFAPDKKVKELPVPLETILPGRLTKMIFSEDGSAAEDQSLWTRKGAATKNMKKEWLGETWFRLKPEMEVEVGMEAAEEAVPAGIVNEEVTQEESLKVLKFFEGLDGNVDYSDYEPSLAKTEDLDKAVDLDRPEVPHGGVEAPSLPSAKDQEEHKLHHANFEPWCEVCVQGQGKEKHHKRKEEPKEHIVYSDYLFFNKEGEVVDKETGLKQKGLVTVLTAICKDSQYPFAIVVPAKGGNEYAIKALIAWIEELGWDKVTIQVDQEHSLHKLYDEVKKRMPERVTLRKSPRYSSQSLADGEMVNGLIAGKVRTWIAVINEKYGLKISCDHYIFPWIVRHSSWTLARYHINKSRTTPYRVITGVDYTGEIMPFGETVMAKFPKAPSEKSAPRWVKGIYAGKTSNSDEHLILTESGAQKYRTVRRLPVGSQYQQETFEKIRGAPWNSVLGITKSKPDALVSSKSAFSVPELRSEEVYNFQDKPEEARPAVVEVPAPAVKSQEGVGVNESKEVTKQKETASKSHEQKMMVDAEGEHIAVEEPEAKKLKPEQSMGSRPERYDIATPEDAPMSRRSSIEMEDVAPETRSNIIAAIASSEEWDLPAEQKVSEKNVAELQRCRKWLEKHQTCFLSSTLANIMDYLDNVTKDEQAIRQARRDELRKLNEVYGAFKPRDRRELSKDLTMFGHRWVDKISEGVAKSRLTCQDFKHRSQTVDRDSSEAPSNFCPTPHESSKKIIEVYSLLHDMPRVKADLSSAFLIAKDQGDSRGQPVMMKPPQEWIEEYDVWLASQPAAVQEELKDVPASEIVWQVDGNLYGRQPAAAQYRDKLETILTEELPKDTYCFKRGKLDACVYRCQLTGTVLVHHVDDFDICGPEHVLLDLLTNQLPKRGCKLKMGDLEYPGKSNDKTSEFLGRTKISIEEAVVTKPNPKHIKTILEMLGLENAKPSPVPGRKLELQKDTPLNQSDKEIYASCVGSAIYLSQDRPDIKFSVKELAKRIREPRDCDYQNLKILGRYLKGSQEYGHVTKIAEGVTAKSVPLQAYCDSDWAGDCETRKSTSGSVIYLAGTLVESGAHTQQGTPATSSGEAEIRSLTECAKAALFVKHLAETDFGMVIDTPRIWSDSSAALQAAKRMGVGKMRHIAVSHLFIQELVKSKQVIIGKVKGESNPSDVMTKHLPTGDSVKLAVDMLGMVDLTQEGLDKHVTKNKMKAIGAINDECQETDTSRNKRLKPWQPCKSSLTIRQYLSAVTRNKRQVCSVGKHPVTVLAGKHRAVES